MAEEQDLDNEYHEEPVKSTKFKSPIPILIRSRNVVFGKRKPDIYTRIIFYVNGVLTISFLIWNLIGYFAIVSRDQITEMKQVPVEEIIKNRGIELGFGGDDFVSRLITLHGVSFMCWVVVFAGLVLLYRKRQQFIYFILGGVIFYIGMQFFYMSFQYFKEDITAYDKIALLIIIVSSILHSFLMRNERQGGSISFFGEVEEEVL
ncbi:MAG: hypothetical protein ACI837_002297 [Crocinitomicaceae bacterium]|jgi:hypothetical protein